MTARKQIDDGVAQMATPISPAAAPITTVAPHQGILFPGDLRDWFAGQAIHMMKPDPDSYGRLGRDLVARRCFEFADAMIAARKEPKP